MWYGNFAFLVGGTLFACFSSLAFLLPINIFLHGWLCGLNCRKSAGRANSCPKVNWPPRRIGIVSILLALVSKCSSNLNQLEPAGVVVSSWHSKGDGVELNSRAAKMGNFELWSLALKGNEIRVKLFTLLKRESKSYHLKGFFFLSFTCRLAPQIPRYRRDNEVVDYIQSVVDFNRNNGYLFHREEEEEAIIERR